MGTTAPVKETRGGQKELSEVALGFGGGVILNRTVRLGWLS